MKVAEVLEALPLRCPVFIEDLVDGKPLERGTAEEIMGRKRYHDFDVSALAPYHRYGGYATPPEEGIIIKI